MEAAHSKASKFLPMTKNTLNTKSVGSCVGFNLYPVIYPAHPSRFVQEDYIGRGVGKSLIFRWSFAGKSAPGRGWGPKLTFLNNQFSTR